jgi:hypothetical protein
MMSGRFLLFSGSFLAASFYGGSVTSASYALSASQAQNAVSAISASFASTASFVPLAILNASASADNTITFTRFDNSTFSVFIPLSGSAPATTTTTTSTTTTTTTAGYMSATGGTITTSGSFKIHTFTTSGTLSPLSSLTASHDS